MLPVLVPAAGYSGANAPVNPDAVTVHRDAAVYATLLDPGGAASHRFRSGFNGCLFVVHGAATVASDGASDGETGANSDEYERTNPLRCLRRQNGVSTTRPDNDGGVFRARFTLCNCLLAV
jgi:hypothetical protein